MRRARPRRLRRDRGRRRALGRPARAPARRLRAEGLRPRHRPAGGLPHGRRRHRAVPRSGSTGSRCRPIADAVAAAREALAPRACTLLDAPAELRADAWAAPGPGRARGDGAGQGALRPRAHLPARNLRGRDLMSTSISPSGSDRAWDEHRPPDPDLIADCVHCGFCLPTCPSYTIFDEEMDSPRGRIVLMRVGNEEGSRASDEMRVHLDRCLGCMACVTACPSGVKYDQLIERARPQIERNAPRPRRERAYRRLIFAPLHASWPAARARAAALGAAAARGRSHARRAPGARAGAARDAPRSRRRSSGARRSRSCPSSRPPAARAGAGSR